ncbi:hypothetical protein OQA88_621 [Cercophora sp. LCS_1]
MGKITTLVVAVLSIAVPLTAAFPRSGRAEEPCQQLRNDVDNWYRENNIGNTVLAAMFDHILTFLQFLESPQIPFKQGPAAPVRPSIVFACLRSITLDKETALKHIEYLRPQWEWQSTLDYLRSPPKGYLSEGVDLLGGLDNIEGKLKGDKYRNEFEFLSDLHLLANVRVRDQHFGALNVLLDLFTFQAGADFVSISKDGVALPEIFIQEDVKHDEQGYKPSPVSTIDGIPVVQYLERLSALVGNAHDPDARYNAILWSLAHDSSYSPIDPGVHVFGLDDTTTVAFRNKTVRTFTNTAFVRANLTNADSAASLYREYGLGNGQVPLGWGFFKRFHQDNYTVSWNGYPRPVNQTPNGDAAGFLSTSNKLKDVAVLAIPSFVPAINPFDILSNLNPEWHLWNMTIATLTQARAQGRTKLILDLQTNGGGFMPSWAVVYLALFPPGASSFPFLWQVRVHPQLAWLVSSFTKATPSADWPWIFRDSLRYTHPNGTRYSSFAEWFGTPTANLTPPALLNLTRALDGSFYPHALPLPWTEPPFQAEDITILTDGNCGSACAVFVTVLTHVHGIRTVVVGGRPRKQPMQAVGKVKGGPLADFGTWEGSVLGRNYSVPESLELAKRGRPPLMMTNAGGTGFNLMNMLDPNDKEGVPLQFRYEAARCRVFSTWEMARSMEALWEVVTGVAWGGGRCVEGSTTETGGKIGGVPSYRSGVEDGVGLPVGMGS